MSFGATEIFHGIDLNITTDTRLGLVGTNGSGKTTLLKIIIGEYEATEGDVFRNGDVRIGYLTQMTHGKGHGSIIELVMSGSPLFKIKKKLEEYESKGICPPEYVKLQSNFEMRGGYMLHQKAKQILTGLGFDPERPEFPASRLSGGERERAYIARMLIAEPDLYLLDEPTNNIDYDGLEWLADFLRKGDTPYIVVSHDRYFLDLVTTKTAELTSGKLYIFTGNFTESRKPREDLWEYMRKQYNQQQEMIEKEKAFIRKNLAGQKTKQAQARRKMLEKIDILDKPVSEQVLEFNFQPEIRGGDDVLQVKKMPVEISGHKLVEPFSAMITRGEKIGLFGKNGSGKSTLLRKLMKSHESDKDPAVKSGMIKWGVNINPGYFAQGSEDIDTSMSPFDTIREFDGTLTDGRIRSLLAIFNIRGDDVFRAVGDFSGGEIAKLSILKLLLEGDNLLVLDEPTNHLDIIAMRALEEAIRQYKGTCIIVSHDRYFLRNTVEKIWAIEKGEMQISEGGIDHYIRQRDHRRQKRVQIKQEKKVEKKQSPKMKTSSKRRKKSPQKLRTELEKIEKLVAEKESELAKVADLLGVPAVASSEARCKAVMDDHKRLEDEIADLMWKWEEISMELEDE